MTRLDELVTACECCAGVTVLTPADVENRPGLSALARRVGTHGRFKATMLAALSSKPALGALTTREDRDFTVALLDAWATALDVLAFYQERIQNEGYLRTATERRSVLEIARLIGYELRPGVAASTHLVFTLDDSDPAPDRVVIPAGTRAQSLPQGEELPQTFETVEEIVARPEWNAIRPRLTRPQTLRDTTREIFLRGVTTRLGVGDRVLLRVPARGGASLRSVPRRLSEVVVDPVRGVTRVTLEGPREQSLAREGSAAGEGAFAAPAAARRPTADVFSARYPLSPANLRHLAGLALTAREIRVIEHQHLMPPGSLARYLERYAFAGQTATGPGGPLERPEGSGEAGLFAFRQTVAPFGHNAALWATLPENWKPKPPSTGPKEDVAFPEDWDESPIRITHDSRGTPHAGADENPVILLEREVEGVRPGGWLLLEDTGPGGELSVYGVQAAGPASHADFGLSGKVTRVTLGERAHGETAAEDFTFRATSVHAASERLELAELPLDEGWGSVNLEVEGVFDSLEEGQVVAVRGEEAGTVPGALERTELLTLAEVSSGGGFTTLVFSSAPERAYRRETVRVNANVAPATHGETQDEVLGSGDAGEPFQSFQLRQKPLTHVSAPTPSGGRSTLELRVGGVRWHEAPDFFALGPEDRRYVLSRDDDGTTRVGFGDGRRAARLPSGSENVTARYRIGLGAAGIVGPDRITLLARRPLGVQSVTNPLRTAGAEDPERLADARRNAPLTVRALDRVVSLRDYEDFARAFSGIAKARAAWIWDGARRVLHLSVAAAGGGEVPADSDLYRNFLAALEAVRDLQAPLVVASYDARLFDLAARVKLHPDHEAETVLDEVRRRLARAYSFRWRDLGEPVYASEVITRIQRVPGVEAVDLDALHPSDRPASLEPRLLALPARLVETASGERTLAPFELLTVADEIGLEELP